MKKLFCFCLFCGLAVQSFAISVGDLFIQNSRFWQNKVSLDILSGDDILAGFEFDLTEHRYLEEKILAFRIPMMLKFSMIDIKLEPFFYPNTGNNASAYGGKVILKSMIRDDDLNNTSSHAYLKFSYANQNAEVQRAVITNKENFRQLVFEGGLNFNFGGLYNFDLGGNIFTYPDNAKEVATFGGIMNQSEIGNLGTIDYVLALARFSVGGGITWLSTESNAKSYISYRYIGYEQDLTAHSIMINTTIPLEKHVLITLVYNHLFETHKTNRDLFGVGFNYIF